MWFLLGCALPVAMATILFRLGERLSWKDAMGWANYAWIGVLGHANIQDEPLQKSILGTEQLATNLISEAFAGVMVLAIGFGLALGCRYLCRKDRLASHSSTSRNRESEEGGGMLLVEDQRYGRLRTGAEGLRGKLAKWGVVLFIGAVGVAQ